jgi:hypothetical protein
MSREIKLILIARQETLVLPKAEPTIVQGVHVIVRIKYSEPIFNQQSGSIVKRVPRDLSRRIHSVN